MSESDDLHTLINNLIKKKDELINAKMEEIQNKENERLLKLSYAIYYSGIRNENEIMYHHKGISCSRCGKDIIGIRYLCSKCLYFNLCSLCEYINEKDDNEHMHDLNHNFIKIRKKEDLDNFGGDYKFEISSPTNRFKVNNENKYEITIKNTGKKNWPNDTEIICINKESTVLFEKQIIGKVNVDQEKKFILQLKDLHFVQNKFCRTVFTLTSNSLGKNFLFPCEIHFYKEESE